MQLDSLRASSSSIVFGRRTAASFFLAPDFYIASGFHIACGFFSL